MHEGSYRTFSAVALEAPIAPEASRYREAIGARAMHEAIVSGPAALRRDAEIRTRLARACACSCCGGLMIPRETAADQIGVSLSTFYRFLRGRPIDEDALDAIETWLELKAPLCTTRARRRPRPVR